MAEESSPKKNVKNTKESVGKRLVFDDIVIEIIKGKFECKTFAN